MGEPYFKLIDPIKEVQYLDTAIMKNNICTYYVTPIAPGEKRALLNDQAFINSLKNNTTIKTYTPELAKILTEANVPFEDVKPCGSCGGQTRKIKYCLVEVYENG